MLKDFLEVWMLNVIANMWTIVFFEFEYKNSLKSLFISTLVLIAWKHDLIGQGVVLAPAHKVNIDKSSHAHY